MTADISSLSLWANMSRNLTWWHQKARNKRIATITWQARAHRAVIDDGALGIGGARPRTRVTAFLVFTCKIIGTFRVIYTFRSAIWRATDKVGQARACRLGFDYSTLRIRSTRRREARIATFCRR